MHDGVRPIRSPRLGAGFCLARCGAERLLDSEIRGGKRIGKMQRPHREVVRGPRPDARQRGRRGDEALEMNAIEIESPVRDRRREAMERGGARTRQADLRDPIDAGTRDLAGHREPMGQAVTTIVRRAERGGEAPRERGRRGDRHLLAEQRADRGLEAIDRAGHAQPRPPGDERGEHGILAEHTGDHVGPRIEIEHPPHARDERHQHGQQRRCNGE